MASDTRMRRYVLAVGLYVFCTLIFFACAPRDIIVEHTKYNHYALLADTWLRGRLDLGHAPPAYTQNNDFASYQGRWYVSFPPFPAVLLLPWAKLAKTPENLRDGQVWLWFAGVGPAVLFLALEKLRHSGRSGRSVWVDLALAITFAFGTVYFFTAEQGTVWFAAHVVAVSLLAIFLLCSLDAEHPIVAGLMVGLLAATRSTPLLVAPLFVLEAVRVSLRDRGPLDARRGLLAIGSFWKRLDLLGFARRMLLFGAGVGVVLAGMLWFHRACYGSALEFGHNLLTVGWRGRIDKWGLFHYHFLARNLGIALSSLPFYSKTAPRLQINSHGLALWLTTPIYLWLLWPRRKGWLWWALLAAILPVMLADLLYQNSGWLQFGYRFSNDYSVLLFAMLAIGGFRLGRRFWTCALIGVLVNTFGALTFGRGGLDRYYFTDSTQQIIYQPD